MGFDDVDQDQTEGYGFRVSLALECDWEDKRLAFGPYFQYWSIEDSEISPLTFGGGIPAGGFVYEPANHTREIGVQLTVTFP